MVSCKVLKHTQFKRLWLWQMWINSLVMKQTLFLKHLSTSHTFSDTAIVPSVGATWYLGGKIVWNVQIIAVTREILTAIRISVLCPTTPFGYKKCKNKWRWRFRAALTMQRTKCCSVLVIIIHVSGRPYISPPTLSTFSASSLSPVRFPIVVGIKFEIEWQHGKICPS